MKLLRNSIITILVLFIIVFTSAYFLVVAKGKDFVCTQASAAIGKEVRIDSITLALPYTLVVKGASVADLASIGSLSVEPSIAAMCAGKIGINKVIINDAKATIIRYPGNRFNFSDMLEKIQAQAPQEKGKKQPEVFVKELVVNNGVITVEDRDVQKTYTISPVDISVITSLLDLKTRFTIKTEVASYGKKAATFEGSGWVNMLKKDMDATFTLHDVDIAAFSAYTKSSRQLIAGTLFASAKTVSLNNDLTVDGHVETKNLQFAPSNANAITNALDRVPNVLVDSVFGKGGSAAFDFSIHTKLDQPKLEGLSIKGDIIKAVTKNIFEKPSSETVQQFKDIGKEFENIGKAFKRKAKEGAVADLLTGNVATQPVEPQVTQPASTTNQPVGQETTQAQTSAASTEQPAPQAVEPQPMSKTEQKINTVVNVLQSLSSVMSDSRKESPVQPSTEPVPAGNQTSGQ